MNNIEKMIEQLEGIDRKLQLEASGANIHEIAQIRTILRCSIDLLREHNSINKINLGYLNRAITQAKKIIK